MGAVSGRTDLEGGPAGVELGVEVRMSVVSLFGGSEFEGNVNGQGNVVVKRRCSRRGHVGRKGALVPAVLTALTEK